MDRCSFRLDRRYGTAHESGGMGEVAAVRAVDYTLRRCRRNAKRSVRSKRRGFLKVGRAMFDLPRGGARIASPKYEKTALRGRGVETIHNVSSRSRGCGGSAATSVNAQGAHHERIDVSGRAESQGLFHALQFAPHLQNTEQ